MKKSTTIAFVVLALVLALDPDPSVAQGTSAEAVVARCAEAMGGAEGIGSVRTLRLQVVYTDHDATPVLHEIRLPNQLRTERPGEYVAVFDGRRGGMLKFDPAKPGEPPVVQKVPEGFERGFETDLVWFYPLFLVYPAEYAGVVDSKGIQCHKLVVHLPLGTRAEYLVDARTYLIREAAVDETFQGQTFHMSREWLDLKPVRGIPYPSRMTYPARGGKTAVAEIRKVELDPVLPDGRFKVPD